MLLLFNVSAVRKLSKGDSLEMEFSAQGSSRIYLTIVPEPEDPDAEAMQQVVHKAAELTGWSEEEQAAVAQKLHAADICTPHAFLTIILSGNINAKLPKNRGFGKRSLRHLQRVAEELSELEGIVAEVAKHSGWSSEDQTKVVRKFVMAGLCSCEELADALLDTA
ncbi:Capn9 [Symbiodinium pilosum]|uniref:Capn9 protein n=1 Tax=Symbiodinium pilosum TaxID=2952 RepID=A0A812MA19_SYMPI|nr:Capn9 [Symbiodinium pilosum]